MSSSPYQYTGHAGVSIAFTQPLCCIRAKQQLHIAETAPNNYRIDQPRIMAPRLAVAQHDLIRDMILAGTLTAAQMATAAGCSTRSVKAIRSNLRHFYITKAPANGGGRQRSITPHMLDALREYLLEKPSLYQEEMALFLWESLAFSSLHTASAGL
jgi:hypothetical protein